MDLPHLGATGNYDITRMPVQVPPGRSDSVYRRVAAKLTEIVSVKDFGAVGDGSTDDSAAIQNAIDYLIDRGGGTLRFPAGAYLIGTKLTISYTSTIGLGGVGAINLVGDGMHNTEIKSSVSSDFALAISATTFQTIAFHVQDLKIEGTSNGGHGLSVKMIAQFTMTRVFIYAHDIGMEVEDCITMSFHHCIWRWSYYNVIGLPDNNASSPNAWSFFGCIIGHGYNQGMEITNPGQLTYVGGSIENNGHTLQSGETQAFGVKIVDDDSAPEGRGGTFIGTYFDSNRGIADIWIWANNGNSLSFLNAAGCRFVRSVSDVAKHGIRGDVHATARVYVNTLGCVLTQHPGYTVDGDNEFIQGYVAAGGIFRVSNVGSLIDDTTESEDYPGATLFAACHFDGTDAAPVAARDLNIDSITKNGTGDYTITFLEGWRNNKRLAVTLDAPGFWYKGTETTTTIQILTVGVDGSTATDFSEIDFLAWQ